MFDKIFRIAFTLTPFILIILTIQKMFDERGFDGALMVVKALTFMGIGVGIIALVAFSAYKKSNPTTWE